MEFGGLRLLPSEDVDRTEPLRRLEPVGVIENFEVACEAVLFLLRCKESLSLDLRCDSGTPSHFELTLGILAGSF